RVSVTLSRGGHLVGEQVVDEQTKVSVGRHGDGVVGAGVAGRNVDSGALDVRRRNVGPGGRATTILQTQRDALVIRVRLAVPAGADEGLVVVLGVHQDGQRRLLGIA